jgi:hypothetical protein
VRTRYRKKPYGWAQYPDFLGGESVTTRE